MDKKVQAVMIENYATTQTAALLEKLAWHVSHTAKRSDSDAVHDLRVEVRRLVNCLRVFKQFFPDRARKKIRRQLQILKNLAGEVRNRDIALDVLTSALKAQDEDLSTHMMHEREKAQKELVKTLQQWTRQDLFHKWHRKLEL